MDDKNKLSVLEDTLFREKPVRILISMKTNKAIYPTVLAREINCTYSHVLNILKIFQRMGIVTFKKTGRIKRVALTSDGWNIANNMDALMKKFGQMKEVKYVQ